MDYHKKYLKYKNKYLALKNQIGGTKHNCCHCDKSLPCDCSGDKKLKDGYRCSCYMNNPKHCFCKFCAENCHKGDGHVLTFFLVEGDNVTCDCSKCCVYKRLIQKLSDLTKLKEPEKPKELEKPKEPEKPIKDLFDSTGEPFIKDEIQDELTKRVIDSGYKILDKIFEDKIAECNMHSFISRYLATINSTLFRYCRQPKRSISPYSIILGLYFVYRLRGDIDKIFLKLGITGSETGKIVLIVFALLTLASIYVDDSVLCMNNRSWLYIYDQLTNKAKYHIVLNVKQFNQLEIELLNLLDHNLETSMEVLQDFYKGFGFNPSDIFVEKK